MSDSIQITTAMVHAAIKQAVKDRIIPVYAHEEQYIHTWDSFERIIRAALNSMGQKS